MLNTLETRTGMQSRGYLIRNVGITSFWQALGTGSGIALDALVLAKFGIGQETDAFFAALAFPALLTGMVQVQGPKILVPLFAGTDSRQSLWGLLSNLLTTSAALLIGLSCLGMLLAKVLIPLQVPGLSADIAKTAVNLNMILFWLVLLRGLTTILASTLYARHRYLVPSSIKLITNSVAIFFVLLLHREWGIYAVAFGLVVGTLVQLLLTLLAVFAEGFRFELVCRFTDPKLRQVFRMLFYPLAGETLVEARTLLENFLASFLPSGNLSALRYANRIIQGISGILLGGILVTSLPLVSHHAAGRNLQEVKGGLLRSTKMLLFISIPLTAWLVITTKPLLMLLFGRGEFTGAQVTMTATLIALLAPYILLSRLNGMLQIPFYADMDARTPVLGTLITFVLNAGLAVAFINELGVYAFPVAICTASCVSALVMSILLQRRFGSLGWSSLTSFSFRLLLATGMMGLALVVSARTDVLFAAGDVVAKLLGFLIPSVLGAVTFIITAIALRIVNWDHVGDLFGRRIALLRSGN